LKGLTAPVHEYEKARAERRAKKRKKGKKNVDQKD
jgi:hypothetical protein